jgi:DNA end-binding protein Ku
MARAVWSGAISFGLVNVPVKAYTAVRDHRVHFHQLEKDSGARIRYEKVSEKSGDEVTQDDIVLGYDLGRGQSVVVDPDELEQLRPRATRTIDVEDFVNLDDIDPVYFDHTYWLAPDGEAAQRAYRLLLHAMEDAKRVGIGPVVMRNKQYLAAIRPLDGALAMSTMRFSDEVVPQSDIDQLSQASTSRPGPKELKLASQIIESLTTDWDPTRYHDTYTEELRDLIERRADGQEISVEEAPKQQGKVVDLMSALQASLDAAKKGEKATATKAAGTTKKAGPRKSAATKATAKSAIAEKAPAKKAPAKEAAAAGKAPAKKAPAKEAAAGKASGSRKTA